jgi:hypothetical protein
MVQMLEKSEYVEVTVFNETETGVRINPEDMGQASGPAVVVEHGTTIRVRRTIGNMLIANKQAALGKIEAPARRGRPPKSAE